MTPPTFENIEPFAIETVEHCHALIRLVEEWIRQAEVMKAILNEMIFKRVPQILCITDSAVADLKSIADILFHLAYIRERLIIRIYEIERSQTKLEVVPDGNQGVD